METMLEIHHISLSRPWASIGQMILPTNSYGKWKLCAVLNPIFPTHFEAGPPPISGGQMKDELSETS